MLRGVLAEFERVCSTSERLLPCRRKDHKINLGTGTTPVSVKPYRYPYLKKYEIEKLVGEMLATRIVQPSSSLLGFCMENSV